MTAYQCITKSSIAIIFLLSQLAALAQPPLQDVTQPGDQIHVAFGSEPPSSESSLNLIDDLPSKWLMFFSENTGVVITPSIGMTLLEGITITAANDAPDRDPVSFLLEGSYDGQKFKRIASGKVPVHSKRM